MGKRQVIIIYGEFLEERKEAIEKEVERIYGRTRFSLENMHIVKQGNEKEVFEKFKEENLEYFAVLLNTDIKDAMKGRQKTIEELNEDEYNLIIDTSLTKTKEIIDVIFRCDRRDRREQTYGKKWASALTMIPTQKLGETFEPQPGSDLSLEKLKEKIWNDGYKEDEEIEIFKVEGINYIYDGHHRNFANIYAGNRLIPYIDLMETDKGRDFAKRGHIPKTTRINLYDHEDFVEGQLREQTGDKDLVFSYAQIYPNIMDKVFIRQNKDDEGR